MISVTHFPIATKPGADPLFVLAVREARHGTLYTHNVYSSGNFPTPMACIEEACDAAKGLRLELEYRWDGWCFDHLARKRWLKQWRLIPICQTSNSSDHGDRRCTRVWVRGARQDVDHYARTAFPGNDIQSPYSPTGQWFGPPGEVRPVRSDLYQVISRRYQDV